MEKEKRNQNLKSYTVNIAKRIETLIDYRQFVSDIDIDTIGSETSLLFADVIYLARTHNLKYCKEMYQQLGTLKESDEAIAGEILNEMMQNQHGSKLISDEMEPEFKKELALEKMS